MPECVPLNECPLCHLWPGMNPDRQSVVQVSVTARGQVVDLHADCFDRAVGTEVARALACAALGIQRRSH